MTARPVRTAEADPRPQGEISTQFGTGTSLCGFERAFAQPFGPYPWTGVFTTVWVTAEGAPVEYLPLRGLTLTTASGRLLPPMLCAVIGAGDLDDEPVTSARTRIRCTEPPAWYRRVLERAATSEARELTSVQLPPEAVSTPASRLRAVSGLDAGRLAAIFGVSRVMYQNWIAGAAPQGTRREHLLEVLALVEEAERRLGDPRAVGDWLLTPVTSTGRRPIDLLQAREYDAFRGLLLRVPTGRERARPLTAGPRTRRRLSREEFDDALARLRPRASREDMELVAEAKGGGDDRA